MLVSIRKRPFWGLALLVGAVLVVLAVERRSAEARGDGSDNLYRCHVEEDSACTIVRQTGRGLVVVSYRPQGGVVDAGQGWSVIVTDGAGVSQTVQPGTVTIVPRNRGPTGAAGAGASASDNGATSPPPWPAPAPTATRSGLPNSAPIID